MLNLLKRLNQARLYAKRFGWPAGLGIARALSTQAPGKLVKIQLPGAPAPFCLRTGSTDATLFMDIFVKEQYRHDWGSKPRFILDCGAHIGLASIYFARRYPEATILAVEASQDNFELLERNTRAYPQIGRRLAAVWGSEGRVSIENPSADQWARRFIADSGGTVPAFSISQLVDGAFIDVLKMDIEGAEREVFSAGDLRWLNAVRVIMIELHDEEVPGSAEAFYRALPSGFRQLVSGDSLSILLDQQPSRTPAV